MKSNQCPATTIDRATDEETRCALPAGHDGRHDDGCLMWEDGAPPLPPLDLSTLDPGIRDTVAWLRERGYQTTDSGDGVSKADDPDALPYPHVVIRVELAEMIGIANELDAVADQIPGGPWTVEVNYRPSDRTAIVMLLGEEPPKLRPLDGLEELCALFGQQSPPVWIGPCGCDERRDPWDRCDDCVAGWPPPIWVDGDWVPQDGSGKLPTLND